MNRFKSMNADELGKLYRYLQQKAEYKKFRKIIDPKQITLDDAIKQAEKKQREINDGNV